VSTFLFVIFYAIVVSISLVLSAILDLYKPLGYVIIISGLCSSIVTGYMMMRTRDGRWGTAFAHFLSFMFAIAYPLLVPFTTGVGLVDENGEPKLFNFFVIPLVPAVVAFMLRSTKWIVIYTCGSGLLSFTMSIVNPRGDDVRAVTGLIIGTVLVQLCIGFICAFFQTVADNLHVEREMVQGLVKSAEREAHTERQANQAKTRFVSVMSHEIRNPLQVVLLQLELLGETKLSGRQRNYLAGSVRASNILLAIVNDILDVTKIEAGAISLESTPMSLREIVEDTVVATGPQAVQRGVELIVNVDPHLNTAICADPTRLKQIVHNLVSNAVKFTKAGEVEVTVTSGTEPRQWQVAVRDTGIGIDDAGKEKLFQSFSQVDETTTRMYGGTGLGLFICRELAEMMGGTVSVESSPGVGSTFTLSFVASVDGDDRNLLEDSARPLASIILYATNKTLVTTLRRYVEALVDSGADHVMATDQAAVVERAIHRALSSTRKKHNNRQPLLVLADHHDCPMALVSALRAARGSSGCVPVMLTEDFGELDGQGWDHQVLKPVALAELRTTLYRALGATDINRVDTSSTAPALTIRGATRTFRPSLSAPTTILVVDDFEPVRSLVQEVVEDLGYRTLAAGNGQEALALVRRHYDELALIFMDCEMPVMDGFEATRAIRAFEAKRGVHDEDKMFVCAMTANALQGVAHECADAGMSGFLGKPMKRADLLTLLTRASQQTAQVETEEIFGKKKKDKPRTRKKSKKGQ
jgi:signal transduction histidine kinase/CheY-like chemotaxis protein